MAENSIILDGAAGISPGAHNANVDGGGTVGNTGTIIGQLSILARARDPERVLYRVKDEPSRSKLVRYINPLW